MGLKARKIQTDLEVFASQCETNLNKLLGTQFTFEYNWNCLPKDIDGWNWETEDLNTCFYNSYFKPVETAFSEMFKDKMYKDAILKQIKTIQIEPGRSTAADYDYAAPKLIIKNTLCANQKSSIADFLKGSIRQIEETINSKLI